VWRIHVPAASALEVFKVCVAALRDDDELKARLGALVSQIELADSIYRSAAIAGTLHTLDPDVMGLAGILKDDVANLYSRRFAALGSAGRDVYNAIRLSARNDVCPMCGQGTVVNLDHILPKSAYLAIALNPVNLVPICSDCNYVKGSKVAALVHPYFDDVESNRWLFGNIVEGRPVRAKFSVVAPDGWTSDFEERVRSHFDLFKLSLCYARQAAVTFSGLSVQLGRVHERGGSEAVREQLAGLASSWKSWSQNCWQVALYDAMASRHWFCDGGFAEL
jgi:hypothetical protein